VGTGIWGVTAWKVKYKMELCVDDKNRKVFSQLTWWGVK
jgi:hypothetical protein